MPFKGRSIRAAFFVFYRRIPTPPNHDLPKPGWFLAVSPVNELVFQVTQEADGGFVAEAFGESIFTEADTWDRLRANVREPVTALYFDRPAPTTIRLHLVRDEVLAAS